MRRLRRDHAGSSSHAAGDAGDDRGPGDAGRGRIGALREQLSSGLTAAVREQRGPRGWQAGVLVVALLAVGLVRLATHDTVFRKGDVFLQGNDVYFYRYLLDNLDRLGQDWVVREGEPLFVTAVALLSDLGAGDAVILAWYPVAMGIATAVAVYAATRTVADGGVAGLAAVGFTIALPEHWEWTVLGFGDHHAFDLMWVGLTLYALTELARREDRRPWAALLAVTIAGQVLSWQAAPTLLLPLGVYVLAATYVPTDRPDADDLRAIVAAVAVAVAAVLVAHVALRWHHPVLIAASVAFAAGIAAAPGSVWAARRLGRGRATAAAAYGGMAVGTVAVALVVAPGLVDDAVLRVSKLLGPSAGTETDPLLALSFRGLTRPVAAFGLPLFLAAWAAPGFVRRARSDRSALAVVVSAGTFLLLSMIQMRFAPMLALPLLVLAGVGFAGVVRRLRRQDLAHPVVTVALFLLIAGPGAAQVAGTATAVGQGASLHDAALWMADDSDRRNLTYPDNYVFSEWGKNRMLNYYVNGESRFYGYAEDHYGPFMRATNASRWYERLREHGAGYVVVRRVHGRRAGASTNGAMLWRRWGSGDRRNAGSGRFQLAWRQGGVAVFRVVPGARLAWNGSGPVEARTVVSVDGATKPYRRGVPAGGAVRLAYPGRYAVGSHEVRVRPADVAEGRTVRVP